MSNITTKRLTKELRDIKNRQSENGITLLNAENLMNWTIQLKGATDTIYQGETFVLQMKFADNYPLDPPEVLQQQIPKSTRMTYGMHRWCLLAKKKIYPCIHMSTLMVNFC